MSDKINTADLKAVISNLLHIIDYMSVADGHQPLRADMQIADARAIVARDDGEG